MSLGLEVAGMFSAVLFMCRDGLDGCIAGWRAGVVGAFVTGAVMLVLDFVMMLLMDLWINSQGKNTANLKGDFG